MIEPNLSLDGPRVPWIGAPPESWDDVVWPEWVPRSVVDEVQSFWSDLGGPKAYRRAAHDNYFDAPPLGYTGWLYSGRHPKAVDGLISGRYVFAWGNMGRVVLDDGTVAVVSGEAQYRKVLLLRTCACDGQSHRGFMWPLTVGAEVVAPDWDPSPECGRGLHGLLWGEGMPTGAWHWEADAKWLVVEAREIDLIDLGRKYKFPRCTIRHVGDRASATEFIGKRAPPSAAIVGGVRIDRSDREVRSGDHGVVVGGPLGYLVSGRSGRSLGGFRSACISRDFGVSVAGDNGHCCAGSDGLSLTGEEGTSTSLNRGTSVTGAFGVSASGLHGVSVGGNHARSHSGTFGTSIAGHSGQSLSMDQGISRTGAGGTSISGHSGISVSGDNGRSISGDGGHSITGRDGCCSAGINGTISIEHGSGGRRVVGCIGIDLKPNVMYKLVGESFVEDSYKRNPAQEIADATVSTYILLDDVEESESCVRSST